MEALSSEHVDEYYKAMDDKVNNLMRRNTWEIVTRKSVGDHNFLSLTCSFKYNMENSWTISKFKVIYCVRVDF